MDPREPVQQAAGIAGGLAGRSAPCARGSTTIDDQRKNSAHSKAIASIHQKAGSAYLDQRSSRQVIQSRPARPRLARIDHPGPEPRSRVRSDGKARSPARRVLEGAGQRQRDQGHESDAADPVDHAEHMDDPSPNSIVNAADRLVPLNPAPICVAQDATATLRVGR